MRKIKWEYRDMPRFTQAERSRRHRVKRKAEIAALRAQQRQDRDHARAITLLAALLALFDAPPVVTEPTDAAVYWSLSPSQVEAIETARAMVSEVTPKSS